MGPLEILSDIIAIAKMIDAQISLAKNNQSKLKTLARTMQLIIASIEGLTTLPDNRQFIQSLTSFQTSLKETQALVVKITEAGNMRRFFYAQTHEKQINHCKQTLIEFIPLLSLGLNAQQLMDRDRDRQDDAADRAAFLAQKEQSLREAQAAAKMANRERDAIIVKQLASMRHRLDRQASPTPAVLPDELIVYLDDIVFDQKIEEGDFGSIYQGTWHDQPVTIKCIDHLATDAEHSQLIREAQVMSRLHHDSMVHFYGACLDRERPCLLTSVVEDTVDTALSTLELSTRLSMAQDLAKGLAYLHTHHVIHGDIHPKHIGITRHQAKWMDFGLAKVRTAGIATLPRMSLEVAWQAPESWQNRAELTTASDVYGFGMLLWTLITGRLPYAEKTASNILRAVQRGERETIPSDVPKACRELIEACWSADPATRPTAHQVARALQALDLADFRPSSPTGEEYYERGVTFHRAGNLAEAYEAYQRAYRKDFFKAYTRVGLVALEGLGGVPINRQKAQADFEHAAACGHADAMFNLGRMAEKGHTVAGTPDINQAIVWYQKTLTVDPTYPRCQEKIDTLTAQSEAKTPRMGRK